jgi:hypothetical protein
MKNYAVLATKIPSVDGKNEPNFMPNNYNFCLVKNENYVEE